MRFQQWINYYKGEYSLVTTYVICVKNKNENVKHLFFCGKIDQHVWNLCDGVGVSSVNHNHPKHIFQHFNLTQLNKK